MSTFKWANRMEKANKRTKTGVPGISTFSSASNRRDGTVQQFLSVFTKTPDGRRRTNRICIATLGLQAAWRKALAIRAEYEKRMTGGATA